MKLKKTLIASVLGLLAGSSWAQADQARAQKIVMGSCFLCHGENGESASEVFPKLAGQHANYIAKQLENFKTGQRKSTAMADMSKRLSADEMLALGQYFDSKPVAPEAVKDTELAAVGRYIFHTGNTYSGVPSCASCHGKDGLGTANLPRLAGQYASYIETQLTLFNQRERTNDNAVMHSIVSKMTPLEIAAVAAYVSGK
jgi:cytochrome c553